MAGAITAGRAGAAGGGILLEQDAAATITRCRITENTALCDGGGIACLGDRGHILHNIIAANTAMGYGGGICSRYGSPTLADNRIEGNHAENGGGIACDLDSTAQVACNVIRDNHADDYGGGLYAFGCRALIVENLLAHNTAVAYGGGAFFGQVDVPFSHNTLAQNNARSGGGLFAGLGCRLIVDDTVIALNNSGLAINPTAKVTLRRNCIAANKADDYLNLDPGDSDVSGDPLFVNAAAGDYRLTAKSPCRDAAIPPAAVVRWNEVDGAPRLAGAGHNLGALMALPK